MSVKIYKFRLRHQVGGSIPSIRTCVGRVCLSGIFALSFATLIGMGAFASQKTVFHYTLGRTLVTLERYSNVTVASTRPPLVYFHLHEDESTSYLETKKFIDKHGGILYAIKQNGKRLVQFAWKGKKYTFDPNRIFTRGGVKATLSKYGLSNPEAVEKVYYFALWISGVISSPRVVAVHNNYNKGYNIKSYQRKDGTAITGIKNLYINPASSTGNFVYTTNQGLFTYAKCNGVNTAQQDVDIEDDGSYSVFAQRHNIDYVNIEATRGDATNNAKLLKLVYDYYTTNKN